MQPTLLNVAKSCLVAMQNGIHCSPVTRRVLEDVKVIFTEISILLGIMLFCRELELSSAAGFQQKA